MRLSHCVSAAGTRGAAAAALARCHSVVLASPGAAPGITTRPSGADICLSIDHKGLALDQTDCDRKLLFSPQKRPIARARVIEWNRVEVLSPVPCRVELKALLFDDARLLQESTINEGKKKHVLDIVLHFHPHSLHQHWRTLRLPRSCDETVTPDEKLSSEERNLSFKPSR